MLKTASAWLLSALVFGAPLAIGGTRWPVILGLAGLAFVTLGLITAGRIQGRGARFPWPLWVPALAVLYGLFQLLPLSADTLAWLSPAAADVRMTSLGDLGLWPQGGHPLSLDPSSTWLAVFHQAAFLCVALTAVNLSRRHRTLVVDALMLGGAVVTLVGLLHWAGGAERIFGTYQALHTSRMTGFFGTFVNNNTLAGYLCLTGMIALGVMAGAQSAHRQMVAAACAALSILGCALSASRGGQVALVLGAVFFGAQAMVHGERPGETARKRARAIAGAALVTSLVALLAALFFVPEWETVALEGVAADSKVASWNAAVEYSRSYWLTGSGRGTFQYVYPQFQQLVVSGTISHPENIVLQFTTEWGLPIGGTLLVGAAAGWMRIVRGVGRKADPIHWGLVAGIGAVALQQLVDFGFEAAGLSLPVAAAFGIALMDADRRRPQLGSRRRPSIAYALLASAVGLLALGLVQGPSSQTRRVEAQLAALNDGPTSSKAVALQAAQIAKEHPADYMVPLRTAALLSEGSPKDPKLAMRWINRALRLFPKGGRAHHIAARLLVELGLRDQAAIEYAQTLVAEPWRSSALVREFAVQLSTAEQLELAVRGHRKAAWKLGNTLMASGRKPLARTVMERLIEADTEHLPARRSLGLICARSGELKCANTQADWLVNPKHDPTMGYLIRAFVATRSGDRIAALSALEHGAERGMSDPDFLRFASELWLRHGASEAAERALKRLRALSRTTRGQADALARLATIYLGRGRADQALAAFQRAYTLDPKPRYAAGIARTAHSLGQLRRAHQALQDAAHRWPANRLIKSLLASIPGPPP